MIAKQSGVCGFAIWLGIAALACAPGAVAQASRVRVQAGFEQLGLGTPSRIKGRTKIRRMRKKTTRRMTRKTRRSVCR